MPPIRAADSIRPSAKSDESAIMHPERVSGTAPAGQFPLYRDPSALPQLLPDPTGPLPLFKGANADAALKAVAQRTSRHAGGNQTDRDAWCSWMTREANVRAVVDAAWLLLALAFRQQDVHAQALQARVFDSLAAAYASLVLQMSHVSTALWTQAVAEAACMVLRQAFPVAKELRDGRLQQLLQQQLRLWVTGLLPSDAAASTALPAPQAKTGVSTAQFSTTSTGPLLTAFMARQQSSRSSHRQLLPALGPRLTHLTVPQAQLKQQQLLLQQRELLEEQQAEDQLVQAQLQQQLQRWQRCMAAAEAAATAVPPAPSSKQRQLGESASDDCSRSSSHRSLQAAACVAAANGAVEQYERSKRAAAAAASQETKALQQQAWQLERRQQRLAHASRARVASASNSVAGWLTESSAGTPVSAASTGAAAATDAECKAQRQLLQGHLRAGEWRLAHAFNATVHSRCLDLTAAAATQQHGSSALAAGDGGGSAARRAATTAPGLANVWQAIAGTARPQFGGGSSSSSGSGNAAGGSIKIKKAARAIVQDVQRMLAATSSGC